jgi:cytidine deaminase
MSEPDWPALRDAARDVLRRAYAPYSRFPVGAAALVDDGRVVLGCNVENASYGLALCAECGLVSALHAGGGGTLVALACVDRDGGPLLPCGRCRQLLWEQGGPDLLVDTVDGPVPMTELLPRAFGSADLRRVSQPSGGPDQRPDADRQRSRGRRYNRGIDDSSALPDDAWTSPASTDD